MTWRAAFSAILFGVVFAGSLPVAATADVYRWVDAGGKVHFSDTAPNSGKVETIVLPQSESSTSEQMLSDSEQKQRQKRLVKILEEERLEREKQKQQKMALLEKHIQYCKRFKNRLNHMDGVNVFYNEDDDGNVRYLSDEEGDRYRREVKQQYQKECSDV